ncbi:hypothetical protein [Stackebrandtia soli]|uniref:hypothetical protein n=1 Tax=Stackebrandtia soli TaxID=1892856 RepID=UPI0039ED0457
MTRRLAQLVISCAVLGVGVGVLLLAGLGSDGYSTLLNGLTMTSGLPFTVVSVAVAIVFVGLAWTRGVTPGIGTIAQPVVVGLTVDAMLLLPMSENLWVRIALLVLAFPILALGVAGYLATDTGAGPTEAAALAFDPPVAFRWSYSVLQGGGAAIGWLLGADVGPGTIAVIFLLGPVVDLLSARVPLLRLPVRNPA